MKIFNMSHDQLQSECHLWLWNEHPELRFLAHANINNLTKEESTKSESARRIAQLKSIGLVKGVLDYEFLYAGRMYYFDFKVDHDKLKKEQLAFISAVQKQGGTCYEIRSLEQFKQIINGIIGR